MKDFYKWVQSLGLYYSFHKIEDLYTLAQNTTNISWAFLKSSAINTANLNNVNPKIIELKGAFLNIGFSFKSISKKILNVKNESIFLDFTTLSIGELESLMKLRIFNQNIGVILIENQDDFSSKIEILEKIVSDYYSDKNLDEIKTIFFTIVSEHCFLPIIATDLYEQKILILISKQRIKDSINISLNSYDRVQIPFSLKTSNLSYFYKY
jgi:hypothetical protein